MQGGGLISIPLGVDKDIAICFGWQRSKMAQKIGWKIPQEQ